MAPIDEIRLNFNPLTLNILNVILGFIVFGVALDIKLEDFRKVARAPKAFLIGAVSQFILFPAMTFGIMYLIKPQPSIALGMILISACPGGNISNFMTQHSRGNTALSISMSAFSTAMATIMTPFNIAFWGSMLPGTDTIMHEVSLNPWDMFILILVLMLIPLSLGIFISNNYPHTAGRLKKFMKFFSLGFFAAFVIFAIIINYKYLIDYVGMLAVSVVFLNLMAFGMGYGVAFLTGLREEDRRAVSIEVGIQNAGLGLILIFNFFDGLGGMAMVAAFWGIWHIVAGMSLSAVWSRINPEKA